jgi:NAD(P)-dependent dehydrogenase (short-subunit alcohol dehydrogenase family)
MQAFLNSQYLKASKIKNSKVWVSSLAVLSAAFLYLGKQYFNGGVCKISGSLKGKIIVITGANTGLGKETARILANRGAYVILACRDERKAHDAIDDLVRGGVNKKNLVFMKLDLSDLQSVRQFCKEFKKKYSELHILINNAAVGFLQKREETKDGFEKQFGTNHVGHFLLTNLLIEELKAGAPSRVIMVSALLHLKGRIFFEDINLRHNYSAIMGYCQSKLANILFAKEFNKRWEQKGIKAVSLHPGVINTELTRSYKDSFLKRFVFALFHPMIYYVCKSEWYGSQTTVYCAVCEHNQLPGGAYFADCKVSNKLSVEARNKEAAARLWKLTEDMVGQKF